MSTLINENGLSVMVAGEKLYLHPFRVVYWERENMLLLADLHLGKTSHFRKSGLAVPEAAGQSNWERMISLLLDYEPKRVLFLGDLFHSEYNAKWDELIELMDQFSNIQFELIIGNHDILDPLNYERSALLVHGVSLEIEPFLFTHEPTFTEGFDVYNLAGHIHPCVRMRGAARQSLRLPCFYFGKTGGILPAFGAFTGMGLIQPEIKDQVYVIAEDKVLMV